MLTCEQELLASIPRFDSHGGCHALSSVFRGKLCADLSRQGGRRYEAGETIYGKGRYPLCVYFVKEGLVKTTVVTAHGEELFLQVYSAGDTFGELCLCGSERSDQAVTMEPSEIVQIPVETLFDKLQRSPQILAAFLGVVCDQLSECHDRLAMLSFDRTMARLARTLLKVGAQLGQPTVRGVEIPHYLRQEDLAEMIGASREVVSSLLNRLRKLRLIEYRRKGQLLIRTAALLDFLKRAGQADD